MRSPVDLWRLTPFSREFGADRGTPMDRYYIEQFLADNAGDIRGRVLEMGDNIYTLKYGGRNVTRSDVLFQREGKPGVTIVDDIQTGANLPSDAFDCIVFTQTFQLLWDSRGAIRTIWRILKPGGVLLATCPGNSQLAQDDAEGWYDYWRLTRRGAERLYGEIFGADNVVAHSHGNPLVICGFLMGLTVAEFTQEELDHRDSVYELSLTLRAVKAGGGPRLVAARPAIVGGRPLRAPLRPPANSLWLRIVRSPGANLRLSPTAIGDLGARAGIAAVISGRDLDSNTLCGPAGSGKTAILDDVPEPGGAALAVVGTKKALAALGPGAVTWSRAEAAPGTELAACAIALGEPKDGFATAQHVAEATIEIALEIECGVTSQAFARKQPGANGQDRLLVAGRAANPHRLRDDIARTLGLAADRVRMVAAGDHASENDDALALLAAAAWRSDKAVRLVPERAIGSLRATAAGRLAVDEWGFTTTISAKIEIAGAPALAPELARRAALHAGGPYYIWNVATDARIRAAESDARAVSPELATAAGALLHETLIDRLARKRRQDPFEFRWHNALRRGYPTIADQWLTTSVGLRPCLEALRPIWSALRARAAKRGRHGAGIACGWYGLGDSFKNATAAARIGIAADGRATLYLGTNDTAIAATMRNVAARTLGIPDFKLDVVHGDTDLAGPAGPGIECATVFPLGRAVRLAALDLRSKLIEIVGGQARLVQSQGRLAIADGKAIRRLDLAQRAPDAFGDALAGNGSFELQTAGPRANGTGTPYSVYSFSAAIAQVAARGKSGPIALERIAVAVDVGRVLDRAIVESRVREAVRAASRVVLGPKSPSPRRIEVFLIEDPEPQGAFGLKSLGEEARYAVMPAIANAIYNATGKRPARFPIAP